MHTRATLIRSVALAVAAMLWLAVAGAAEGPPSRAQPLPDRLEGLRLAPFSDQPAVTEPGERRTLRADDPRLDTLRRFLQDLRRRTGAGRGTRSDQVRSQAGRESLSAAQLEALVRLRQRSAGPVEVRARSVDGSPRQIKGGVLEPAVDPASSLDPELETARLFLRKNRRLLLLEDPDAELRLDHREEDGLERRHLRFSQTHGGVALWPSGELIVHLDPEGNVDVVDGTPVPTPVGLSVEPAIDREAAVARAQEAVEAIHASAEANLIVYATGETPLRLAWRVDLESSPLDRWRVVVDARDGGVVRSYSLVMTENVIGSGTDLLGVTRSLNVWREGGTYYLLDTSKQMFDASSNPPDEARGAIYTLDLANQPMSENATFYFATSSNPDSWGNPDVVSSAFNLSETYDYYLNHLNRDAIDGAGGTIYSVVRVDSGMQNAYWNGAAMFYGDADRYAAATDVVAHEWTHGVTQHESNLEYVDQSGALNESMSDIFGEAVENFADGTNDWLMGTNLSQIFRNLADPGALEFYPGRPFPSNMSEFVDPSDPVLDNFRNRDNGGVHINMTIVAHAFYQLAEGLPGAIGIDDAARIFYRANSFHLVRNSQLFDARLACIQSAEELFGASSNQATQTDLAFDAVELSDGEDTPPPEDFPGTSGSDSTLFVFRAEFDGSYFLGRKEDAFDDGPIGVQLAQYPVAPYRVAVVGDGSYAVFVDELSDLCFVNTDGEPWDPQFPGETEACAGLLDTVWSVTVSPDGTAFAFVLIEGGGPSDRIDVIDIVTDEVESYTLEVPSDSENTTHVLYADTMDFTSDNRYLVYDALSEVGISESWAIYALDRRTGIIFSLLAPVEGLHFAYPALSQTNDNFIVFDAFDEATWQSYVITANINNGELEVVGIVPDGVGVPGYTGDDRAVVYAYPDSGFPTEFSLWRQPVADRLTPVGDPEPWIADADVGVIYRRGSWSGRCGGTDADGDRVFDLCDNCPADENTTQEDYDGDGIGDACEDGAELADADGSLRVDGFDLAALARAFGSVAGELSYNTAVDFDRDGVVDGDDLALMAAVFGDPA